MSNDVDDDRTPEKKKKLLAALDRGMVMIHVDARRPGVLVPDHLKAEAHLLLNLSYRFSPADLTVNEWGVRATLTFSGKKSQVSVPWSALYAISSHVTREFWMFPDDMPPEILASAQAQLSAARQPDPAEEPREGRPRPGLRQVSPPADDETATSEGPPTAHSDDVAPDSEPPAEGTPTAPNKRSRSHLRVIK